MNAEQLNTIATAVVSDVSNANIPAAFKNLVAHLQALSTNPADEGAQTNVGQSRDELFVRLDALKEKRWPAGMCLSPLKLGHYFAASEESMRWPGSVIRTKIS